MKNYLIKALVFVYDKLFHKQNKNVDPATQKILIVSTTGIGDTLWGTPAIRAIKKTYQNCHLSVITSQIGEQLLRYNPHIDEIFIVKNPALPSLLRLFFPLRKKQFDTILLFHSSQRPLFPFCKFLGGRLIGTQGSNKGLDSLFESLLPAKRQHEITRRLEIAAQIGIQSDSNKMELFFTEEEKQKAYKFDKSIIAFHPGAKNRFKQWDPAHFITVGKYLCEHYDAQIVITGSPDEKVLCEKIANQIPSAMSLAGTLSIRQTAALFNHVALLLTNDTGPMHLAFTQNTPTLALFSPTDPVLCGPLDCDNVHVIAKPPTCLPCLKKRCGRPFCLDQISPKHVINSIKTMQINL